MKIESPSSNYETNDPQNDDVLIISIINLHSAQKAFQIELQKLKYVGREDHESDEIKTTLNRNWDLKVEFEDLMKQKMEIEVQCVAISKAIECLKVQIEVMVEQKKVVVEQMEMMKKVEDAEVKAIGLKMKGEKLQVMCEEILEKEEVWKVRSMVCGLTSLFCVQLMLFGLVVFLFFFYA